MPAWLATLFSGSLKYNHVVAGVNDDDCAVLDLKNHLVVVTTDFLNSRPIATELRLGGIYDLGRLSVLANLSDLCGSGADPRAFLAAVVMPRNAPTEDFETLMKGICDETEQWKIPVVGGDTKLGAAMALLGIAIGSAHTKENLFLKNRACPGDILWCSGNVGSCSAAVLGLGDTRMDSAWRTWAESAVLKPTLPLGKSRSISAARIGHGGIDISDGLGNDIRRMAQASGVGVIVNVQSIPLAPEVLGLASALGVPAWSFAFGVGGDLQFVVTTDPNAAPAMEQIGMVCIGKMTTAQEMVLHHPNGVITSMPYGGHRDARQLDFVAEARALVTSAAAMYQIGR
jgi:thiamine-monophosphate kinase